MKNEDLYVYKKSDFYEDFISSQKEYYEREQVDALLAEKDKEIALLKERICNGDVSRLTWIDDCIAKDKEIAELKKKLMPCLNGDCILTCEVVEKYGKENAELKSEIRRKEAVEQRWFEQCMEARSEAIRLKRALWNLRACYADMMQKRIIECKCDGWVHRVDKWIEVERKCLKKAEEYK